MSAPLFDLRAIGPQEIELRRQGMTVLIPCTLKTVVGHLAFFHPTAYGAAPLNPGMGSAIVLRVADLPGMTIDPASKEIVFNAKFINAESWWRTGFEPVSVGGVASNYLAERGIISRTEEQYYDNGNRWPGETGSGFTSAEAAALMTKAQIKGVTFRPVVEKKDFWSAPQLTGFVLEYLNRSERPTLDVTRRGLPDLTLTIAARIAADISLSAEEIADLGLAGIGVDDVCF